jgi:signal transduction histidine kinase
LRENVDYNGIMKTTMARSDAVRLIRFAAILWIGYLAVLAIITEVFQQQPPQPSMDTPRGADYLYYLLYGIIALICLCLAYWPWIQAKLKWAFIPLIIAITTLFPVVINQLTGRLSPLGPRFGSPEGSVLAMFPFLFIGLLLVAWQYKWQYMLVVILIVTGLNIGLTLSSSNPGDPPFQGVLVVILIQTVVFLAVGFSISFLMSRLRAQQQSLEAANIRLTHHASTLEQLATSRERNRLALELHDTLAHTLSGLSVELETLKAYWDVDRETAHKLLDQSLKTTRLGLEETRRTLKALRASPLDDLGLPLALSKMVKDAASRAGFALDMPEIIMLPPLSPDVEQCIYRVAQEAVTNVVKHAKAKKLEVKLEPENDKIKLTVRDDGIGFDIKGNGGTGHFGLAGMQERARLAGGDLEITSRPGDGTTVRLTV